ncbi:hypothetical protein BJ973_008085 [Actinoplanes tereljensis]|uniref:Uncharacterized protein n=1 Tax=Paractinoplanes tereljensis TaxID=571912 RepID=A0A919TW22_9ACTN|nr:hypothetical protein [Actinoplanes tereljensis]GIF24606.1 hypothetical protein Ate02nite_73360 [Actinoplanes tereljensis]
MSRNRRRSTQRAAEIDEQVAELPSPEPLPETNRGRRRSARPAGNAESRPESAEAPHSDRREPPVGALSGQLPHGTDHQPGVIATAAGHYLRQAARDDAPARFGMPAGDVDDAARQVWEIAFGLVVRRRFESETPLVEISRTVATAVHEHAVAGLPILDAEMLVRHALGETVPIGDIDGGILLAVHLLLFASLADELALGDQELDAIIADAEEKAASLVSA